jgi:diphthine synthase
LLLTSGDLSVGEGALGMLTFVGLGLGDEGLSLAGANAIRSAKTSYLEYYTTPHAPRLLREIEQATGRVMTVVDRTFVEDGKRILQDAQEAEIVLAVQGDPMIATTHNDLRTRAILRGIETRVIHGATIATAAASASGLHYYKFGATVTFTRRAGNYHSQVYTRLHKNLLDGSHTLLLLEYDTESESGATPNALMEGLLEAEKNLRREVVRRETFLMVLSRMGTDRGTVRAGSLETLSAEDFGAPPHVVIVPGPLHFSEQEAVAAICSIEGAAIPNNAGVLRRTAQVLLPRYVEKAKKALETARDSLKDVSYDDVFENAALYMRDAETFLANGEDELAMLSIGYAEGLIDSLSFSGKLRLEW